MNKVNRKRWLIGIAGSLTVGVALAATVLGFPAESDEDPRVISLAEGRQAVFEFIGTELELEHEGILRDGVPQPVREYSTTHGYGFSVNAHTGEIVIATMPALSPPSDVDVDAAREIAANFVQARYAGFDGFRLTIDGENLEHGEAAFDEYRFEWREFLGEAIGPSLVAASVDARTGDVITYIARRVPVTLEQMKPNITRSEAINVAVEEAGYTPSEQAAQLEVWFDPRTDDQYLVWRVRVNGLRPVGDYPPEKVALPGNYEVIVDALSGRVLFEAGG